MALWGIGMGAQESVMRAQVAAMAPKDRRGTAFGLMNMIYGFAWFAGSALLGILYDTASPVWVAVVAVLLQLAALPVFLQMMRRRRSEAA
jgi:MFS-type transporter involved in bile tolerance (Atg22 family)